MKGSTPLAETLTALLEERRMTVKELAKKSGVARSTLGSWKAGSGPASLLDLKRVSNALGVSFEFLCLGRNDTDPRIEERKRELIFEGLCVMRLEKVVLPGTGAKE